MRENIYALYDTAAQMTLKPLIISTNDVMPLREVQAIAENRDTVISKHAGDFELLQIGTIDLAAAHIERLDTPRHVANIIDLIAER